MSFLSEANKDAVSVAPEQAATGPRVGFLESWAVAWGEQTRAAAMYGIENQMWQRDSEQVRAMREAGIEDVPYLSPDSVGFWADNISGPAAGVERYLDVAKYYTDGGEPGFATELQEYDKRIGELREQYPNLNLQTSREMWEGVQAEAQRYEQMAINNRRTLGGEVGAFIGGSLASMNPNTDPLNFITLGVGGIGKTIVGRIATQGAAQGVIEGINQITGVQEQRRLLGVEYGLGDAVSRVAGAAIGGAAIQGVGEVVGLGLRRWFKSTPNDVASPPTPEVLNRPALPDTSRVPPQAIPADEGLAAAKLTRAPETYIDYLHEQSPLSTTRAGRARTVLDLDYATTRLEEWGGERPWGIPPKTDTATTIPRGDFVAMPDMTRFVEKSQIDDIARRVDPDTFRRYDELAQRKQTYRRWLDELSETRDAEIQQRIDAVDQKIFELAAKADETGGKRAAKLRKDIAALEAEKAQIVRESAAKETPDMARVRRSLMQDDIKMRDLAPLVSRAYARAQKKWTNTAADREALVSMMREGRTDYRADPQAQRIADSLPESIPQTLADRAPILRQADKVSGKVARDADAGDVAQAIVAENMKVLDEALDVYRASLDGLLAVAKEEVTGFKTAKGSAYTVRGGKTVRNKAARNDPGHEGDSGVKPETEKTIYVETNAAVLSAAGLNGLGSKGARVAIKDGKASLLTWNEKAGRWGVSPEGKNVKLFDEPAVGRYPLELWKKTDDVPGYEAYAKMHAGNEITEITTSADITLTNGQKLNLDKDKLFVPNEDGTGGREVTVRQLLEENKMDEYEIEAVGTCSLRKTS